MPATMSGWAITAATPTQEATAPLIRPKIRSGNSGIIGPLREVLWLYEYHANGLRTIGIWQRPGMGEIEILALAVPFMYHSVLVWFSPFLSCTIPFQFDFLCSGWKWVRLPERNGSIRSLTTLFHLIVLAFDRDCFHQTMIPIFWGFF